MKIRIVERSGLYMPQQYVKTYYSWRWKGYGTPNVKFGTLKDAKDFIAALNQGVKLTNKTDSSKVVYQNYAE